MAGLRCSATFVDLPLPQARYEIPLTLGLLLRQRPSEPAGSGRREQRVADRRDELGRDTNMLACS
jgi:hypothetical protein